MPKGQRSNREKRKPKSDKAKPAAQATPFGRAPGLGVVNKGGAGKKAR